MGDVSSEPAYHLHLLYDTALKESSSGTQRHSEHTLDNSVNSKKSGLELLTESCFLHHRRRVLFFPGDAQNPGPCV